MASKRFRDSEAPTSAELAEIEAEWPVIAAELAVVDAEIVALRAEEAPTELDRRRLRRVQSRLTRRMSAEATGAAGSLGGAA